MEDGGGEVMSDALEQKFQTGVTCYMDAGTKPGSSARPTSVLTAEPSLWPLHSGIQ